MSQDDSRRKKSTRRRYLLTELLAMWFIDIRSAESRKRAYGKLLLFIDNTSHFRVDRLLGLLPSDGTQFRICTVRWKLTLYAHRLVRGKSDSPWETRTP